MGKKYKLLKETPEAYAGMLLEEDSGNVYCSIDDEFKKIRSVNICYAKSTVETSPDWFFPIPEKINCTINADEMLYTKEHFVTSTLTFSSPVSFKKMEDIVRAIEEVVNDKK